VQSALAIIEMAGGAPDEVTYQGLMILAVNEGAPPSDIEVQHQFGCQ
jgi:hypothetical protein